jgi:Protein of unknown function (DUF2785)
MRSAKIVVLAAALAISGPSASAEPCPPAGMTRDALLQLPAHEFRVEGVRKTDELALLLLPCLASADPQLRDRVTYEALATWMRGKQLSPATAREILNRLQVQLAPDYPDGEGFAKPFSALVLAEVVRMDRVEPFLSATERGRLVDDATRYVRSVTDYRGYDETVGWRHGVAHGADLLLQLALNPNADVDGLRKIVDAAASQVVPRETHFYIYGESGRLARPIVFAARRQLLSAAEWQSWLSRITAAAPLATWDDAFWSQAGLAKRHNTLAFLNALYTQLRDEPEADRVLREPLVRALGEVP